MPKLLGGAAALAVAAYGVYVGTAWLRYGRPRRPSRDEADPLLDRFMPEYEVVERHSIVVNAPAEITLEAARDQELEDSALVQAIFKGREFLMGANAGSAPLPRGIVAKTLALGWGLLAEVPGREVVIGAATQPWDANVVFRALPPDQFASFRDPGYVKIAWTLRTDPIGPSRSVFRTETRVLACGPTSRAKFRTYWALLSPGIILIRLAMLRPVKREAERRAQRYPQVVLHLP